jgi:hypothetical protein
MSHKITPCTFCNQKLTAKREKNSLSLYGSHHKELYGTREKVISKRINLEGNTHTQEINVSQLPV